MKFLYTGLAPLEANRDKLFQMADKYGVEILISICDSDDVLDFPSSGRKFHLFAAFCEAFYFPILERGKSELKLS